MIKVGFIFHKTIPVQFSDQIKCPACNLESDPKKDFVSLDKFGNPKVLGTDVSKNLLENAKAKFNSESMAEMDNNETPYHVLNQIMNQDKVTTNIATQTNDLNLPPNNGEPLPQNNANDNGLVEQEFCINYFKKSKPIFEA